MPTFTIGPFTYPTKAEATDAVRAVLHRAHIGQPLQGGDDVLIRSLIEMHPNAAAKIGSGVASVRVEIIEHGQRGFWIYRHDGTCTDFSYRKAMTKPSKESEVKAAMRRAIADQIVAYRNSLFNNTDTVTCPVTSNTLRIGEGHVDHIIPFAAIVAAFMEGYRLSYDSIILNHGIDGQIGRELPEPVKSNWVAFHQYVAKYRYIHPAANRRRGAA